VSSPGNGHTATCQQLCRSHCVYVGADSSQTPLQFVDILYRSLVNEILNQPLYFVVDWIQVWYTRVDGELSILDSFVEARGYGVKEEGGCLISFLVGLTRAYRSVILWLVT